MKVERVGDATEIGKVARQATEQNQEQTPAEHSADQTGPT